MIGNFTNCPRCSGRMVPIVDGTYTFDDERGQATIFQPPTRAQAIRIKTAVQWAQQALESGGDEAFVKEKIDAVIERDAPLWKGVIDALLSEKAVNLYALLGFILMLLVFFGLDPASQQEKTEPAPSITIDQMRDLFEEFVRGGTDSDTPSLPSPGQEAPKLEGPPTMEA